MTITELRLLQAREKWTRVRLTALAEKMTNTDEDTLLRTARGLGLPLRRRAGEWWLVGLISRRPR